MMMQVVLVAHSMDQVNRLAFDGQLVKLQCFSTFLTKLRMKILIYNLFWKHSNYMQNCESIYEDPGIISTLIEGMLQLNGFYILKHNILIVKELPFNIRGCHNKAILGDAILGGLILSRFPSKFILGRWVEMIPTRRHLGWAFPPRLRTQGMGSYPSVTKGINEK